MKVNWLKMKVNWRKWLFYCLLPGILLMESYPSKWSKRIGWVITIILFPLSLLWAMIDSMIIFAEMEKD